MNRENEHDYERESYEDELQQGMDDPFAMEQLRRSSDDAIAKARKTLDEAWEQVNKLPEIGW